MVTLFIKLKGKLPHYDLSTFLNVAYAIAVCRPLYIGVCIIFASSLRLRNSCTSVIRTGFIHVEIENSKASRDTQHLWQVMPLTTEGYESIGYELRHLRLGTRINFMTLCHICLIRFLKCLYTLVDTDLCRSHLII